MKNIHIKSLKEVVPTELRLEVYKKAILCIENNIKIAGMCSHGLCLLLPCLLWDLKHPSSLTPDNKEWNYQDTSIAFPELTEEVISKIERSKDRQATRANYLKAFIKKLSKTRTYKELYPLVLKALEEGEGDTGICQVIGRLWMKYNFISAKEYTKLKKHLKKNKPTAKNKFKSFYEEEIFDKERDWWWDWMERGSEYRAVRIAFIKALILTLK